jgi:hypothetical protein
MRRLLRSDALTIVLLLSLGVFYAFLIVAVVYNVALSINGGKV